MKFHAFLIKYAEIAIKGNNRKYFEDALVKQIRLGISKAALIRGHGPDIDSQIIWHFSLPIGSPQNAILNPVRSPSSSIITVQS